MNTLAPSFLIGSSSFLQVLRTCMKAWMSSNFGKFATELLPLIDVRIEFLLNILKTNRPIKTKFCIHIIIDKIYFGIVNPCFLAHLSRRLKGELIVYRSIWRPSVRPSVNIFKLKYLRNQWANRNQILSEASFGWGIDCFRFWTR